MPIHPFNYRNNGSIVYQFSEQEIVSRDIAPFLQQFDYRRHKNLAVARRHVGCLSLAFSLPQHPEIGRRLVHPAEIKEFRIFAEQLLNAFPALGLLIDTHMDRGFPNIVYSSMDAIRLHVSKESVIFVEPEALDIAIAQMTGGTLKLASDLGVSSDQVSEISHNLGQHLIKSIKL